MSSFGTDKEKTMNISIQQKATITLSAFLILTSWTLVWAQDSTRGMYEMYATVPTEIPGVFTFVEPPAGFNALSATDQQLAMYGFPPRPDTTTNSQRYHSWANKVKSAKFRWKGPLKVTDRQIKPSSLPSSPKELHPNVIDHQFIFPNVDWSGVGNIKNIKKYNNTATANSSFQAVEALFNVPVIEDAYGLTGCAAGAVGDANMFVGIDGIVDEQGLSAGALLAGGIYADNPGWLMSFGTCTVFPQVYYAEFSTPASSLIVQEFNVNPGDTIAVEVWDTSATSGYVYISDDTTFAYATYQLSWTGAIVGNSAEYIIARDWTSGSLNALGNYTGDFWTDAQAVDFHNDVYSPGTNSVTTWLFEMTDDAGDQVISQPIPYMQSLTVDDSEYGGAIYFYAENCAANYGCTP
jgi:hypothetical protein